MPRGGVSATMKRRRIYTLLIPLLLLGVVLFFGNRIATFYTDWLWYHQQGQDVVFSRIYGTRIALFFVFGAMTFLLAYFNVWLTERIAPPSVLHTGEQQALFPVGNGQPIGRNIQALTFFRNTLDMLLLIGALIFGILTGLTAQAQWDSFLRFLDPTEYGETDPVFGRDIGFYIFTFPFLRYIQNCLFTILLLIGGGVALVYSYQNRVDSSIGRDAVQPHARAHLSAIIALALLVKTWGYYLDRFELLFSQNRFPGAGYTDLHSRLPLCHLLIVVSILAALLIIFNIWRRTIMIPVATLAVWSLFFLGGIAIPPALQRLRVLPNEATRETPYIERAIKATRSAYDLDSVQVQTLVPENALTQKTIAANRDTLANIRLWDDAPLQRHISQRETTRQYYRFPDVDSDRYWLDKKQQHVALSVREITPNQLETSAQTWQNLHLRYTHGYGMVVSSLSKIGPGGTPSFLVRGLPPQTPYLELELKQPRVYYGLSAVYDWYNITNTKLPEFDFPDDIVGNPKEYVNEEVERGGIPMTPFNRFVFAARYATWSIMLSQDITSESRIRFVRRIPMRVKRLAPFLLLDNNPYPIVVNGRLLWVQDAYTTASTYPYSAFSDGGDNLGPRVRFNYMRGAVKAVVDAYDGTTNFYAVDEDDPMLRTYRRLFPGLIKQASDMPAGVRLHQKYPTDLFVAQRDMLQNYHVQDAGTFYTRADTWSVPHEVSSTTKDAPATADWERHMAPEYTVSRLPGENRAEYTLLSPFTNATQGDMSALFVARCDGDRYGERILYRIPNAVSVDGPAKFAKRARSDSKVRPFLFATNQRGSRALFGKVHLILLGRTLINLAPLYVEADESDMGAADSSSALPELKQVVIGLSEQIAMQPDLNAALQEIISTPTGGTGEEIPSASVQNVDTLIDTALRQYEQAQSALRNADFASYGTESKALGSTLRRLKEVSGNSTNPPIQNGPKEGAISKPSLPTTQEKRNVHENVVKDRSGLRRRTDAAGGPDAVLPQPAPKGNR